MSNVFSSTAAWALRASGSLGASAAPTSVISRSVERVARALPIAHFPATTAPPRHKSTNTPRRARAAAVSAGILRRLILWGLFEFERLDPHLRPQHLDLRAGAEVANAAQAFAVDLRGG